MGDRLTMRQALDLLRREVLVEDWPTACGMTGYITLPNGYKISAGYGKDHYCSNRLWTKERGHEDAGYGDQVTDCEVQIQKPDGSVIQHGDGDCVWGHVATADFLRVVDAVATVGQHASCPCPDCVLVR